LAREECYQKKPAGSVEKIMRQKMPRGHERGGKEKFHGRGAGVIVYRENAGVMKEGWSLYKIQKQTYSSTRSRENFGRGENTPEKLNLTANSLAKRGLGKPGELGITMNKYIEKGNCVRQGGCQKS